LRSKLTDSPHGKSPDFDRFLNLEAGKPEIRNRLQDKQPRKEATEATKAAAETQPKIPVMPTNCLARNNRGIPETWGEIAEDCRDPPHTFGPFADLRNGRNTAVR